MPEHYQNNSFLITGASGQLAKEFQRQLAGQGAAFNAPLEDQFDISKEKMINQTLDNFQPSVVINCAAYNDVEKAETDPKVFLVNTKAVEYLGKACRERNITLVHFSSDYVFDGNKNSAYLEKDLQNPLNKYGDSKYRAEKYLQEYCKNYLILRLSWMFGDGKSNFLYKLNSWLKGQSNLKIAADEFSCPTYTEDVVKITLMGIQKQLRGLFHLTNSGCCSRYAWAQYYLKQTKPKVVLRQASMSDFPSRVKRPRRSCLSNQKLSEALKINIPTWQDAVDRFVARKYF